MVMQNTKNILEQCSSVDQVIEIIGIFQVISRHYAIAFGSHFKDITDLLIGWLIDVSTPSSLSHVIWGIFSNFLLFRKI